ncbi:MAG: GTP cyclohydrolase II [Chloroflexota bacterium]
MNALSVTKLATARIPTHHGEFQLILFSNNRDTKEHLALVMGHPESHAAPLTRIHSECITGDVFGSQRCDCGEQLDMAMAAIAAERCGVILYLRQEGRNIGLFNKLRAYNLQDEGHDTVEANLLLGHEPDERDYALVPQLLQNLNIDTIRLMTNNPHKIDEITKLGITVTERVALQVTPQQDNISYLRTKAQRMAHLLDTI